jgi:hypothetical protein
VHWFNQTKSKCWELDDKQVDTIKKDAIIYSNIILKDGKLPQDIECKLKKKL